VNDRSVDPRTRAGDPFAYTGGKIPKGRLPSSKSPGSSTHEECVEAMHEEEARLGRPMSQREREAFARGFHAPSYRAEIGSLMASGLLDDAEDEG
jgi:hypothetical protein